MYRRRDFLVPVQQFMVFAQCLVGCFEFRPSSPKITPDDHHGHCHRHHCAHQRQITLPLQLVTFRVLRRNSRN